MIEEQAFILSLGETLEATMALVDEKARQLGNRAATMIEIVARLQPDDTQETEM